MKDQNTQHLSYLTSPMQKNMSFIQIPPSLANIVKINDKGKQKGRAEPILKAQAMVNGIWGKCELVDLWVLSAARWRDNV